MKICVYGAASNDIKPIYIEETERLGRAMAARGITLVFGGGAGGMMGASARGVRAGNGKMIAVVPRFFNVDGILFDGSTETIYTDTMRDRKRTMEDLSDAFIVSPGGIGTMDEFFEIFTLRSLDRHHKPIGILNINGFYDGMFSLLRQAAQDGFIRADVMDLLTVSDDSETLLDALTKQVEAAEK